MDQDAQFQSQMARLIALGDHFNNRDDFAAEMAAANLIKRKPAYWTSARGGSNATAGIFTTVVNQCGRIDQALDELAKCYPGRDYRGVRFLDDLLPLNAAAATDLAAAYLEIRSFRTRYELIRRTDRVELAIGDLPEAVVAGSRRQLAEDNEYNPVTGRLVIRADAAADVDAAFARAFGAVMGRHA